VIIGKQYKDMVRYIGDIRNEIPDIRRALQSINRALGLDNRIKAARAAGWVYRVRHDKNGFNIDSEVLVEAVRGMLFLELDHHKVCVLREEEKTVSSLVGGNTYTVVDKYYTIRPMDDPLPVIEDKELMYLYRKL
jgi:hypothetical protein